MAHSSLFDYDGNPIWPEGAIIVTLLVAARVTRKDLSSFQDNRRFTLRAFRIVGFLRVALIQMRARRMSISRSLGSSACNESQMHVQANFSYGIRSLGNEIRVERDRSVKGNFGDK